jgi:hypothetical protein
MIVLLHTDSVTVSIAAIVVISCYYDNYYCSPDRKRRGQVANVVLCIYGFTN